MIARGFIPSRIVHDTRFFGTLKAECVWQQRFRDRDHAFRVIPGWMDRYHEERPDQALGYGYLTPREYRERLAA